MNPIDRIKKAFWRDKWILIGFCFVNTANDLVFTGAVSSLTTIAFIVCTWVIGLWTGAIIEVEHQIKEYRQQEQSQA